MAKTAKSKKKPAPHSRAARRAVSPSDPSLLKSIKNSESRAHDSASPPPHPASQKPHILAAQNAGIIKKSKPKAMKRAQRLRQLKGMERAADNMDKLELKRQKSIGKGKKVRERAQDWNDVNEKRKKGRKGQHAGEEEEVAERRKEREWVSDEEMDEVDDAEEVVPEAVAGEVKALEVVVPESIPLPVDEEVDEYL